MDVLTTTKEELEVLDDLSAVEVYFLINQKDASYKLLLQHTLSHLVAKEVLEASPMFKSPKKTNRLSRLGNIRFRLGSNFQYYQPLPHEEIFLRVFNGDMDVKFYFKHYIIALHESIGNKGFFIKELLLKTMEQRGLYANNRLKAIFGFKPRLTTKGQKKKKQCRRLMSTLRQNLPGLIQSSSVVVKGFIKQLGSKVLLIDVQADKLKDYLRSVNRSSPNNNSGLKSSQTQLFPPGWYLLNSEFEMRFDALFEERVNGVFQGFIKAGYAADVGCGGCGA